MVELYEILHMQPIRPHENDSIFEIDSDQTNVVAAVIRTQCMSHKGANHYNIIISVVWNK